MNLNIATVQLDKLPAVAAKQILVDGDHLFLVDAAGQLWVTEPYSNGYVILEPSWARIGLPTS